MKILDNAELHQMSSMKVRARCKRLIYLETLDELSNILKEAKDKGEKLFILGGGTNVLFGSSFIDGWIICTKRLERKILVSGELIEVSGSYPTQGLVHIALENGLSGLEGLNGIPGTVGGAIAGNAGTRMGSIGDNLIWVDIMGFNGKVKRIERGKIEFGYRHCSLKGKGVIVGACFKLKKENPDVIRERMDEAKKLRESQPKGLNTLGCIFKNPPETPAGKLIEELGLKGERSGDAWISEIHGNFIVSDGSPDPDDVLHLIEKIKKQAEKRGIKLEEEIEVWR